MALRAGFVAQNPPAQALHVSFKPKISHGLAGYSAIMVVFFTKQPLNYGQIGDFDINFMDESASMFSALSAT